MLKQPDKQEAAKADAKVAKADAKLAKADAKAAKADAKAAKADAKAATKAAKAQESKSPTAAPSTAPSTASSGSSSTPPAADAPATGTTTWVPDNAVAKKLATKSKLLARVQNAMPGADLNGATFGFKNFGQFVAAVNVSQNLGIPFADLKAAMTGLSMTGEPVATGTTTNTVSLGQAIQQLKPGADAAVEAQKAQVQADAAIADATPAGRKAGKRAVTTSASR